jgi:uncharacterized protein (DUF2132 family)
METRRQSKEYMSQQDLNGITLEAIVTRLQAHYGWDGLAKHIDINCFISDPSIKSSLKFLRKTRGPGAGGAIVPGHAIY